MQQFKDDVSAKAMALITAGYLNSFQNTFASGEIEFTDAAGDDHSCVLVSNCNPAIRCIHSVGCIGTQGVLCEAGTAVAAVDMC